MGRRGLSRALTECNFSSAPGSFSRETNMNNIIEVTEERFETEVLQSSALVLVDFYASWCGPCKMLAPLLDQVAGEFGQRVKFVKLDVEEAPTIAGRYDITGVPTLMLFHGGKAIDTRVGLLSPSALRKWIEAASNATSTTPATTV